jgi:hypothetical protein
LRLFCTSKTPARDTLDVWPSLPLIIWDTHYPEGRDDIAVLERSDRVVQIILFGSNLENVLAAMQVPFPELTHLNLLSNDGKVSVLPDSFLGGSAPRLQTLLLQGIPFPGLPKLLLSATHLVTLRLCNIPHSGYISPEAIVAVLSTLTSLENLFLEFESPLSRPDWGNRRLPPPTHSVLPLIPESGSHVLTAEPRTTYAAIYGIVSRGRIPLLAFPSLICRLDFSDRSSELYPTMTIRRMHVPVSLSEDSEAIIFSIL